MRSQKAAKHITKPEDTMKEDSHGSQLQVSSGRNDYSVLVNAADSQMRIEIVKLSNAEELLLMLSVV